MSTYDWKLTFHQTFARSKGFESNQNFQSLVPLYKPLLFYQKVIVQGVVCKRIFVRTIQWQFTQKTLFILVPHLLFTCST